MEGEIELYNISFLILKVELHFKVTLHTAITFCNLYIPPSTALHLRDLAHVETQLPKPFVIVGDFNSHNYLWEGNKTDANDKVRETFMTRNNICLFNDDTPTYLHPATGSFTSIDLTMCSPSHFMGFTWRVEENLHGSAHFPIILQSHYHPPDDRPPKCQFHNANWNGPPVKHIENNGKKITQPRDISNTIGEAISFNSSSAH